MSHSSSFAIISGHMSRRHMPQKMLSCLRAHSLRRLHWSTEHTGSNSISRSKPKFLKAGMTITIFPRERIPLNAIFSFPLASVLTIIAPFASPPPLHHFIFQHHALPFIIAFPPTLTAHAMTDASRIAALAPQRDSSSTTTAPRGVKIVVKYTTHPARTVRKTTPASIAPFRFP